MKCSLIVLNAVSDNKKDKKGKSTDGSQSNKCLHVCNTVLDIVFEGSHNKSSCICYHHKESDDSIDYYSQ